MCRSLVFALLVLAGCRQAGLQDAKGALHLSPAVADFGLVYPGKARAFTLHLRNDGPPVMLRWTGPDAPFGLSEDLPTEAPSGEVDLTVRFAPAAIGTFHALLEVEAEKIGAASVSLLGEARGIPECPPPSLCHEVAFDLEAGKCLEHALPDAATCAPANVCLLDTTCLAGRCVGTRKNCDDSDACTTDTCNAVSGCEHLPAPSCPGDGKCQIGVCNKVTGCELTGASGGLVSAQELKDPAFALCNHPHAYGFGADLHGQLFIAFSPTVKNPPLLSGAPTTVMSFSRDGVFRWKYSDVANRAGEIALARGLLYAEHSTTAVLTSTGLAAFTLAEPFGRATVTRDRLVLAPQAGATSLEGYEPATGALRWKHPLAAGQTFSSNQLRLASWSTHRGEQTIALTFTEQNGKAQLHGIVARDGSEAFTCEVTKTSRTPPQLFEVAEGSIAVMDGATGCGTCDPGYADKSAAFHTIALPHISPATNEPWVGTYGGAGHDHREE